MKATVRRWYGEPALVEAVFEMKPDGANGGAPRQLDAAGMKTMGSRLRGFSKRAERLQVHAPISRFGLAPGKHAATGDSFRICTWNEEGDRAVQFGGGVCAFNVLSPYGHYEDHLPSLRRVIHTYLDVAKLNAGVHCAHRHLNVFRLKLSERPDELFSFYPPLPRSLILKHVAVSLLIEAVTFRNGVCNVRLKRQAIGELEVLYHMEVDSEATVSIDSDMDAILEWHQIAHEAVNRAFDMSITPTCRKRLREL